MSCSGHHLLVLLACLGAPACATDLGVGAGARSSGHLVGYGRLAVSTRAGTPLNEKGPLFGIDLGSRAEQRTGSRWLAGIFAGYGSGPSAFGNRVGFEAFGEFGFPLRETLFASTDLYAGAAATTPIRLDSPRKLVDVNQNTWIMRRHVEVVPMLRARFLFGPLGYACGERFEITGGLALRLRAETDLF
jgi:hypothetical protein